MTRSKQFPHAPVYYGERLRAVAMPLGGIGTGSVALCGDGSLRQWQLTNSVNHLAHVPHSFFAVRVHREGDPPFARVLQSDALYAEEFAPVPTVNDYVIPSACRKLLATLPGVRATEFRGEYPLAEVSYLDDALPAEIALTAYSPFCPLDAATSGLPAVIFRFSATNPGDRTVHLHVAALLQNFIGWDGVQEIEGAESPLYGGNANQTLRLKGLTAILMENQTLPSAHPQNGTLCLAALHEGAFALPAWDDPALVFADFARDGQFMEARSAGPTPYGRTINGALSVPLKLAPGETGGVTFALCWHFPNRYVDWIQWFSGIEDRKSQFWLGNAYNTRFASAAAVAEHIRDDFDRLDAVTKRFHDALFHSSVPYEILDTVSSQMSILRTPTCLWTEDGKLHAFEGCNGASTGGWHATGGCCPLTCTHVFAYEMSLSALFPDLERTMRETELFGQLHPTGYLPHRVTLPLYLPRPWERPLGGPDRPALDGLLSLVLKTYREHRRCGDPEWLTRAWPQVKKAIEHVMTEHDADGSGVIRGDQPNTYDVSVFGPNLFIGALYLAALRAAEEMALRQEEPEAAALYRERFDTGSRGYDTLLWNGEYWIHKADPDHPDQAWGTGCHADQLFGQWWAYLLDLGDLLPLERVKTAVSNLLKFNFRHHFHGHVQKPRQFASDDEAGLLICSWPRGDRPAVPTAYSDEVWTGIEYEVAALCFFTGLTAEGLELLRAVRARHNGARRSPWNDVECGDHYARALSSWALLEAACGTAYDASKAAFTVSPRLGGEPFRALFLTDTAWGTAEISLPAEVRLTADWGTLALRELTVPASGSTRAIAQAGTVPVPAETTLQAGHLTLRFPEPISVSAGETLTVLLKP